MWRNSLFYNCDEMFISFTPTGIWTLTLVKGFDPRKATETKLKLVAHDIRRIGYIEILYDIKPHWPRKGV